MPLCAYVCVLFFSSRTCPKNLKILTLPSYWIFVPTIACCILNEYNMLWSFFFFFVLIFYNTGIALNYIFKKMANHCLSSIHCINNHEPSPFIQDTRTGFFVLHGLQMVSILLVAARPENFYAGTLRQGSHRAIHLP